MPEVANNWFPIMRTVLLNIFRVILQKKKKKTYETVAGLQTHLPSIKVKKSHSISG